VKRTLSAITIILALVLSACQPPAVVQQQVVPTLVSVTVAQDGSRTLLLQGRYFGDGLGGQAAGSYVLVGANLNGEGGLTVRNIAEWSDSRIRFQAPEGIGHGYVFVFVAGMRSNGLPANLP
jgi:hypothetical protein